MKRHGILQEPLIKQINLNNNLLQSVKKLKWLLHT